MKSDGGGMRHQRQILGALVFVLVIGLATGAGAEVFHVFWSAGNTGAESSCSGRLANGMIQACNVDGTGLVTVVTGLDRPFGVDLDTANEQVYWIDWDDNAIGRANVNGTGFEILFSTPTPVSYAFPSALTLDTSAQKMYYGSFHGEFPITRCNYDGSAPESIVTNAWASSVTLDLGNGHIYWAHSYENGGEGIYRADLSGGDTNVVQLVDMDVWEYDSLPRDVVLDVGGGKMYWTAFPYGLDCPQSQGAIYSANLDGTGVATVYSGLDMPWGLEIDPADGSLFWTDIREGTIRQGDIFGSSSTVIQSGLAGPVGIALAFEPLELGQIGGSGIPALGKVGVVVLLVLLAGLGVLVIRRV